MARRKANRSARELMRASVSVGYEVGRMGNMLDLLLESKVTIASAARDQAILNALLDSFLQATRNLYHFLYSQKPWPSDIIAEDFFDDERDWCRSRPAVAEFHNGSLVNLISKRLVHLTWDRTSGTKPSWGSFRIAWELCKALEVFIATVPSSRVDPSLSQDVAALILSMRQIIEQYGGIDLVESAPISHIWNEDELSMGTGAFNTNIGSEEESK